MVPMRGVIGRTILIQLCVKNKERQTNKQDWIILWPRIF